MYGRNSPFSNDTSSYAGSLHSTYSTMDDMSSVSSSVSRPSAKSIYMQRKEYAMSINQMMDKFQYRVEHLFTCDLDGKELKNVKDCLERLALLDQMGRVWGQDMLLEVRGASLLLTDIETKEELESVALSEVLDIEAVLNGGVFNSLLTVSVQPKRKRLPTVFMFQCDDVRAVYVQRNLSRVLSRRSEDPSIRNSPGPLMRHDRVNPDGNTTPLPEPRQQEPAEAPVLLWSAPDYEDDMLEPEVSLPQEDEEEEEVSRPREEVPSPPPSFTEEEPLPPPRLYTELDRDVDVLNHLMNEIEIFLGRIAAVEAKNAKKKKKKKKGKAQEGMPPAEDFKECLHKIKYGFNLLGILNGHIDNPSAADFIHSLFSALAFIVSHSPENLPATIVAPLMTPQSIRLLSEEASADEDQLWQSLGEAWNIPSTQWPEDDEDIPTYNLQFFDGWQPPEVTAAPGYSQAMRRQDSLQSDSPQMSAKWNPPRSSQKGRSSLLKPIPMQVKYDFTSRNYRELTVRKGEMVDLLDKSRQWWKVRNSRGEEGHVPNNILGHPEEEQTDEDFEASPILTKKSRPAEVKAWLEDKGFSQITVRCLGGLSGSMLLGISREELKKVCPEEGGRVYFQLQAVKSALVSAS